MRVADPENPAATLGAARLVPAPARQRLREVLASGRRVDEPPSDDPASAPPPELCPACGAVFSREEKRGSGWQWSRFAAHLVAAHDAWWPDLDLVAGVAEEAGAEDELGDDDEALAGIIMTPPPPSPDPAPQRPRRSTPRPLPSPVLPRARRDPSPPPTSPEPETRPPEEVGSAGEVP